MDALQEAIRVEIQDRERVIQETMDRLHILGAIADR